MASPQDHLRAQIRTSEIAALLTSLSLPPATAIEPLQCAAAFHSIYLLHFASSQIPLLHPAKALNSDGSITLVLRVSGNHIPRCKTMNEVAILIWLERHTAIPVPAVVRYDCSSENILRSEFTLLEKVPGRSVDKMYHSLSWDMKQNFIRQLTDMLVSLHTHSWTHIGGLQLCETSGEPIPGPLLDETFWFSPDVLQYWGPHVTVDSLNPTGPYKNHADLLRGYLRCFIFAIRTHESLAPMLEFVPRLEALSDRVPLLEGLESPKLLLAHRDLHFANIMATEDGEITGILDWEFACVVPALRWDPVRAFLWSGSHSEASHREKTQLREEFEKQLCDRGTQKWWEDGMTKEIEYAWAVVRFMRAIVDVCPRGGPSEQVDGWKASVEEALGSLQL